VTQKVAQGIGELEILHPQQWGVNPELRRMLPKRRADQHGLRWIHGEL